MLDALRKGGRVSGDDGDEDSARGVHAGPFDLISLADGFALATARRLSATLATFDARVRNAAKKVGTATI